jgi:hypothetical protein
MNTEAINTMCAWERKKAVFLMNTAENYLNMDLSGHGLLDVNQNSGYVYLWLEDYNFCLFMPINCKLQIEDIYVLHSSLEDGTETEEILSNFSNIDEINDWIEKIEEAQNN